MEKINKKTNSKKNSLTLKLIQIKNEKNITIIFIITMCLHWGQNGLTKTIGMANITHAGNTRHASDKLAKANKQASFTVKGFCTRCKVASL